MGLFGGVVVDECSNGGAEGGGCGSGEGDGGSRGEGNMCDGVGEGEEDGEFGKGEVR